MNTPDQASWKQTPPTWVSRRSLLIAWFSSSIIALPWCDDSDSFHPGKIVQISKSINPSDIHMWEPVKNIKIIEDAHLNKTLQWLYISLEWSLPGKKIVNLDRTWTVILNTEGLNGDKIPAYKIYKNTTENTVEVWWKNSRNGIWFEYNDTNGTIKNLWLDAIGKTELKQFVWEIAGLL